MSELKDIYIQPGGPDSGVLIRADRIVEMYVNGDTLFIITEDTKYALPCEDSDPREELQHLLDIMDLEDHDEN